MREPKPLAFGADWARIQFDGVPAIESVLQAFVGCCQECGRPAEKQYDGSVLIRFVLVEGTLYGDTFCLRCVEADKLDEPFIQLPALPTAFLEEGGD